MRTVFELKTYMIVFAAHLIKWSLTYFAIGEGNIIGNILGGVIFREPIICKNVPRLVPGWTQPIIVGRHAFGDQYRATDFRFPGKGKLTVKFIGDDGTEIEHEVFDAPSSGVAMAMYNLDDSIRDFARASMNYALSRKVPCYLSTKKILLHCS